MRFIGGINGFIKNIDIIKRKAGEKRIIAEAHNMANAIVLAKAGVDIIQLDKFSPGEIEKTTKVAKEISKNIKISAAGGVNFNNVKEIASLGVDLLVTSAMYFGTPSDIKADIQMI